MACLFAIRAELNGVIRALQASKPRDVDIAAEHWDPVLIAEIRQRLAGRSGRGWSRLRSIYCSNARCPQCPHGPFWYRYRPKRSGRLVSVRYVGKPFFSEEALAKVEMSVRGPIAHITLDELRSLAPDELSALVDQRSASRSADGGKKRPPDTAAPE